MPRRANVEVWLSSNGIAEGDEWEPFAGMDIDEQGLRRFLDKLPFNQSGTSRQFTADEIESLVRGLHEVVKVMG